MALNASIFGNMLNAPKSPEEYAAERENLLAARQTNVLKRQKADEYTKGIERQNQLLTLLSGGADSSALRKAGYLDEASAWEKNNAAVSKDRAAADEHSFNLAQKRYDTYRKAAASRYNDPNLSKQSVLGDIEQMKGMGILTPELADHLASQLPEDPMELRKVVKDAAMSQLNGEQLLTAFGPKPEKFDSGGQIITRDMNPNSPTYGQNTGGAPIVKVATPGDLIRQWNNIRSNARMSANAGGGAGGVANAGGAPAKPAKPLPVAALKMQQDSLDAIGTAGGINADLGAVLQQVESGSLQLGPVKNAVGSVRNTLGVSNENSQNLATFKATLEKLRNDSLRLNKGVQTDGDAQRAWNELLSNINDPGVVAKRLKEIRSLNSRAIELHNDNLGNIRSNYGAQPIDTTKRATQKPAIESAVKRINSDEEYNALPSGATFIAPDGKTRRKP